VSARRHAVRCAGGATGHVLVPGDAPEERGPCGWTGRRRAYDVGGTPVVNREVPCPRCGGEVELAAPRGTRP
jgi:hypothetical protein